MQYADQFLNGAFKMMDGTRFSMAAAKKARELDFSRNTFKKGIPKDSLPLSLKKLNLHTCHITNIPDAVLQLTNLEELDIGVNEISSLPSGMSKLQKLRIIRMGLNRFKKVFSACFLLKKFQV